MGVFLYVRADASQGNHLQTERVDIGVHFFKPEACQNLRMFAEVLVDCGLPSQALLARNFVIEYQVPARPDLVPLEDSFVVRGRHVACCADCNDLRLNEIHDDIS